MGLPPFLGAAVLTPVSGATTVDKAAANRFIKHAIAQVKAQRSPGDDEGPSNIRFSEGGDVRIPIKVTSKMEARAQYQKELAELGSEEEEGLEVIEDADDTEKDEPSDASRPDNGKGSGKGKGKGKAKAVDVDVQEASATTSGRKRRRPQADPFAGMSAAQVIASLHVSSCCATQAMGTRRLNTRKIQKL